MNICLKFICIFTYVISSDGLTKKEPNAKKIEGHFFFFQMFLALPKKVIILKRPLFSVSK